MAAEIAIRVPSTAALFDAWSVEPLVSRPLSDDARERIVDAWSEVAKQATGTPRVRLVLLGSDDTSLQTVLSQTFVVLAWVALWGPSYRLLTAASYRLGRRYFAELAEAEITIHWD
jgi:hypothetical protein